MLVFDKQTEHRVVCVEVGEKSSELLAASVHSSIGTEVVELHGSVGSICNRCIVV